MISFPKSIYTIQKYRVRSFRGRFVLTSILFENYFNLLLKYSRQSCKFARLFFVCWSKMLLFVSSLKLLKTRSYSLLDLLHSFKVFALFTLFFNLVSLFFNYKSKHLHNINILLNFKLSIIFLVSVIIIIFT